MQARVRNRPPRRGSAVGGVRRYRRGLSLVETLVVIAIIAILISILLTVLHSVMRLLQSWR